MEISQEHVKRMQTGVGMNQRVMVCESPKMITNDTYQSKESSDSIYSTEFINVTQFFHTLYSC